LVPDNVKTKILFFPLIAIQKTFHVFTLYCP